MKRRLATLLGCGAALAALAPPLTASNHREAPITALDHKADITDLYAFMSYGPNSAGKMTLIMSVDPLLDTANGPNWFPFDDEILYELKIDNNHDAREDITLQFRFETDQRLPNLFQVYAGADNGYAAPANSPAPVAPGTPIVPPRITSFQSAGMGQRQRYTVTAFRGNEQFELRPADGRPLYAVPANVGPRTMDYASLYEQGINTLSSGIKVFAGTTDDAFWIDLGAAFDTFNLRTSVLRIDTAIPLGPNEVLIEFRGLGLKRDTKEERDERIFDHNMIWGPFGRNLHEDLLAVHGQGRAMDEGTGSRFVLHGREENSTIHDEVGMRHYYAEWSRRMGRPAFDPMHEGKSEPVRVAA